LRYGLKQGEEEDDDDDDEEEEEDFCTTNLAREQLLNASRCPNKKLIITENASAHTRPHTRPHTRAAGGHVFTP
jgi:hypothetical protein